MPLRLCANRTTRSIERRCTNDDLLQNHATDSEIFYRHRCDQVRFLTFRFHDIGPCIAFDLIDFRFVSDTSNNANGFHLEYSIQGCGDMLKMSEGTFSSPNYPNGYKHQQECLWTIIVPYGNLIELTIEDYDLEYSPNCTKDGLSIAYNRYLLNETTFNICGTAKPTDLRKHITSHTNELYLKLYSNGDFTGRGFNASYKTIPSSKYMMEKWLFQ